MQGNVWRRASLLVLLVASASVGSVTAQYGGGDGTPVGERMSEDNETSNATEREAREARELPSEEGVAWLPVMYFGFAILAGVLLFYFWRKAGKPGNPRQRR